MAVQLCKSDGSPIQSTLPPELRNLPRVKIRNEPPHTTPDHHGKKISARSDSHYACAEPEREEVWRSNYKRRSIQFSQCGFRGVPHQPYQDIGHVILDDRRLLMEGLGHASNDEQSSDLQSSPPPPTSTQHHQQQIQHQPSGPPLLPSPYRVKLRAKTPSQFPTELASLDSQLDDVDSQLELIRKGRGLFRLMKEKETMKQETEEQRSLLDEKAQREEWLEPDAVSDFSLTDSQASIDELSMVESEVDLQQSQAIERNSVGVEIQSVAESTELPEAIQTDLDAGFHSPDSTVNQWYRRLCVLVWVLQSMKMESPDFMSIPFSKCWSLDHPPPDEYQGRRLTERRRRAQHQYENSIVKPLKLAQMTRSKAVCHAPSIVGLESILSQTTPTVNGAEEGPETDQLLSRLSVDQTTRKTHGTSGYRPPSRLEELRMRRQKKLTPLQMQNLTTLLEEELNYSKKQSRSRINAILKEADKVRQKQVKHDIPPKMKGVWQLPPISLNISSVKKQFSEAEEGRRMVVHEQLTAMERDRRQAIQQRFSSLQVSGNMWEDLAVMREGVHIETTAMARKRLLMNYEWYTLLLDTLPSPVKAHPYCRRLLLILSELANHMRDVGPAKMSRRRLIQVLATLRPWELRSPDVADAVEFLIQHVIYVVTDDYEKWLEQHSLSYLAKHPAAAVVVRSGTA